MLKKIALELSLIALVSAAYGCEDNPDDAETSGEEAAPGEHGASNKKSSGGSAAAGKSGSAGAAAKAGAGGASAKPAAVSGGSKSAAGSKATNDDAGPGSEPANAFALTSAAFEEGDKLPKKYRCEAAVGGPTGPNPALAWSGAPASTKSFALLLRDRTFMNYQHWTIYDIPAEATKLPEGVPVGAETEPEAAKQANNSPGLTGPGYYGPCGQSGMNMYEFVLYALDVETLPDAGSTGTSVESALADHVIAMTSLKIVSGPE
jgi:Raf kinase inhibitor-like YbhB/YbcL family protein